MTIYLLFCDFNHTKLFEYAGNDHKNLIRPQVPVRWFILRIERK